MKKTASLQENPRFPTVFKQINKQLQTKDYINYI